VSIMVSSLILSSAIVACKGLVLLCRPHTCQMAGDARKFDLFATHLLPLHSLISINGLGRLDSTLCFSHAAPLTGASPATANGGARSNRASLHSVTASVLFFYHMHILYTCAFQKIDLPHAAASDVIYQQKHSNYSVEDGEMKMRRMTTRFITALARRSSP
jgi:hypothetical protein